VVRQRRTVVDAKIEALRAKKATVETAAGLANELNSTNGNTGNGNVELADEAMLQVTDYLVYWLNYVYRHVLH
jgi:hypothetical protein